MNKFRLSKPTVSTELQSNSTFSFQLSVPHAPSLPTSPEPAPPKLGGYKYDIAQGKHNMEWLNWDEMCLWVAKEEAEKIIELRVRNVKQNERSDIMWQEKHYFMCAREGTGGDSKYAKTTERGRKIPTKWMGCTCPFTITTYPDRPTVLGKYRADHSHDIGSANIHFTRLSKGTRVQIAAMLRKHMPHDEIVCNPSALFICIF